MTTAAAAAAAAAADEPHAPHSAGAGAAAVPAEDVAQFWGFLAVINRLRDGSSSEAEPHTPGRAATSGKRRVHEHPPSPARAGKTPRHAVTSSHTQDGDALDLSDPLRVLRWLASSSPVRAAAPDDAAPLVPDLAPLSAAAAAAAAAMASPPAKRRLFRTPPMSGGAGKSEAGASEVPRLGADGHDDDIDVDLMSVSGASEDDDEEPDVDEEDEGDDDERGLRDEINMRRRSKPITTTSLARARKAPALERSPVSSDQDSGAVTLHCEMPGCTAMFDTKRFYREHIQGHRYWHNGRFYCDFPGCSKSFCRGYSLKYHRQVHTEEAPFVCTFENCQKRFSHHSRLKRHLASHNPEARMFVCDLPNCGKRFSQKCHLKIHLGSHARRDARKRAEAHQRATLTALVTA